MSIVSEDFILSPLFHTGLPYAVISESDCISAGVMSLILARSHTLVEIDLISKVILILPLIPKGLLSVTRESMCRKYW